jgi:hypothetical protein
MSNLDEQLKIALRREEPSPDFTARVLARAQAKSEIKESRQPWFAGLFRLSLPRWTALAAAACLLVLAAVFLYRGSGGKLNRGGQVARSIESANGAVSKPDDKSIAAVETGRDLNNKAPGEPHRANIARAVRKESHRQDLASSEGERAKQQLELALYIASSKLNLAEKAIARLNQEDQPAESPEHDEHRMDR